MRRQSMEKYQGISILFFSRQSKARLVFLTSKQSKANTSCDSKMADKTVVHERENQCKAEIKETSSAQCPVGLKGRRPHAPRGPGVPLQWPAACLSSVPRGPALVRGASSGPVALGAPVGFPVAVVPFPTPGAGAPGFTGWLRGARGGRPRTRLIVPAAGPRRGRGAGLAPRRTRSGPCDGIVPSGSLRRRSWAACAAVVGVCGPGH